MGDTLLSRLLKDRAGNFGIMTAILLPVTLGAAGLAIDFTNAIQTKTALQGMTDAAALAAASSMAGKGSTQDAEAMAKDILAAQIGNYVKPDDGGSSGKAEADDPAEEIRKNTDVLVAETGTPSTGKTYNITVNTAYNMPLSGMSRLFGLSTFRIAVTGSAMSSTEAKNALSMYLVLDRSGSMDENTNTKTRVCIIGNLCFDTYVKKLDALKIAAGSLLDTIKEADPEVKYARLGAVSYNDRMQNPTPLDWGTEKVRTYIQALTSNGQTNSGEAMQTAYSALSNAMEATYHKNKNGQDKPSKYVIFMTDGENNVSGADQKTKTACANAKTAGIEVYSVAFMAPKAGQDLLKTCATDASHYYDAQDAVQLIAAFKAIGEKASQTATRLTN